MTTSKNSRDGGGGSGKAVLPASPRLALNVLWNLIGTGAPLLVAIVAIPLLIKGMGTARFGVLTLAWMVVGYFSLFDFGLGRALTKLVAEKLGEGSKQTVPPLVWTAMILMAFLGIAGAVVLASLSHWLVFSILEIPEALRDESLAAFYLLAASVPVVITTSGLRGILEAHQRFDLVNLLRIPLGIFTFVGPLAVLSFSNSLFPIIAVLVLARAIAWILHYIFCLRVAPELRIVTGMRRSLVKPLLGFGGWMTVSNIVGPMMVYMDRFLIGAMVSMSAVAYYTTPYEVVTKLTIIPVALMGVLFPAFVSALAQDPMRAARLYGRAVRYVFLVLFPVAFTVVVFAHEGLTLWLDDEFAEHSTLVLQILVVGVLINSLARVPFGWVQGAGRPDLTAKLHLVELPFYLVSLWWLLHMWGIAGAAVAWTLRVAVDAIVLFILAQRSLDGATKSGRPVKGVLMGGLIMLLAGAVILDPTMKVSFVFSGLLLFFAVVWYWLLDERERTLVRKFSGSLSGWPRGI